MEDKVEEYIESAKKKSVKFMIAELLSNAVEIAVFVVIMMKITNNFENISKLIYIIAIMFIVISSTTFINIKIHFGSFKSYSHLSSIQTEYNQANENLRVAQKKYDKGKISVDDMNKAKNDYDNAISQIADKI